MSEKYTPTTARVRTDYVAACVRRLPALAEAAEAEFDRWLAQHDAETIEAERQRIRDQVRRDLLNLALERGEAYDGGFPEPVESQMHARGFTYMGDRVLDVQEKHL